MPRKCPVAGCGRSPTAAALPASNSGSCSAPRERRVRRRAAAGSAVWNAWSREGGGGSPYGASPQTPAGRANAS
eukprot:gene21001-biopygen16154